VNQSLPQFPRTVLAESFIGGQDRLVVELIAGARPSILGYLAVSAVHHVIAAIGQLSVPYVPLYGQCRRRATSSQGASAYDPGRRRRERVITATPRVSRGHFAMLAAVIAPLRDTCGEQVPAIT